MKLLAQHGASGFQLCVTRGRPCEELDYSETRVVIAPSSLRLPCRRRFDYARRESYSPGDSAFRGYAQRLAIRQTAQKLLYDLKTRQDLADALTRGLQATDKSRLAAGTLVDFWVIPNKGSGKKPYWEPNCRVIAMGSDKNNRTVIIRRATYSQYQEVERIRVRPSACSEYFRFRP